MIERASDVIQRFRITIYFQETVQGPQSVQRPRTIPDGIRIFIGDQREQILHHFGIAAFDQEPLRGHSPKQIGMAKRPEDRKSTRLNSSHVKISYAVFCLKK